MAYCGMIRLLSALVAVFLAARPAVLHAQRWDDPRTRALVQMATDRRALQLADTGLIDYRARAHGYLTFLAQLGDEQRTSGSLADPVRFTEPPKVVKADELQLEVFWKAPNLSKQRIMGRRDTLLLPTDISYHRDHLGIVQNNFPNIIRLGDGDEVEDVPHPLSAIGLTFYQFAISDSLRIRLIDRTIEVLQVKVRPSNDQQPGVIGALFIDRASGDVVRMAFNFTRSAFKDRELEDLSIVLENGLIEGRFWLPRQQEIEIRRTGTWMKFPARGIIRGRWEICCYDLNRGIDPRFFAGPEIVLAPRSIRDSVAWSGRILDSLPPDVRAVTLEEVRRVQEEARALVAADALARTRSGALAASQISDFVRFNRVEGFAVGAGAVQGLGNGVSLSASGRWGTADSEAKGEVALGVQRASGRGLRVIAFRQYRDAGDEAETSLLKNSIAAQEFASDYTQPYDTRGASLVADLGVFLSTRLQVEAGWEKQRALEVNATPASGYFEPTIPAMSLSEIRTVIRASRPTRLGIGGFEMSTFGEVRGALFEPEVGERGVLLRGYVNARAERPYGDNRLVLQMHAGAVGSRKPLPVQELIFLGGPVTGPGYDYHEFVGRSGVSQRIEWRTPVPFMPISLGRFGRVPSSAALVPFAHAVYTGRDVTGSHDDGIYPSLGVGFIALFELLRVDVAHGLRDGRWTFSIDFARDFWGLL